MKVPKKLQPYLWSVRIEDLDTDKDKVYIINQILAYGGLEELQWLFKVYSQDTLRKTFLEHPIKTYRPAAFNFTKNFLLGLNDNNLIKEKYVVNTPRYIR